MGRYLIRRTLFLILVLWIVSVLTFLIFVKLPAGDPARRAAGTRTTEAQVEEARERLGLNDPIWVQYTRFAKGLVPWPGWFLNEQVYYSFKNFVPVKEEIFGRIPVTITLAVGAGATWLLVGIPIGIISAIRRRSLADRAGMLFALFGVSAPVFWLGLLFLYIFWFKFQQMGWPHAPGSGIPTGENLFEAVLAGRFVMPWIVLALSFAALYSRMTRGNLIETMGEDYIRTARAKGLSERRVIFKHGLRAALTPVVTMFGMDLGLLLGGAIITETVFNLPGVGQYTLNAIKTSDFPAVMGVTVFAAFFVVVANLVVDVMYAALDPRVRYS
ncbi:MAG: ABC transporter permease [Actinobacteria bacterium]|nr:ABC transporter permease [Actinomycetota bacterium]